MSPSPSSSLERLRRAADEVREGWFPGTWHCNNGPKLHELTSQRRWLQGQPYGVLPDLIIMPGQAAHLWAELDPPPVLHGVDLVGDTLELTLNTLYPVGVVLAGRTIFTGDQASAAAGPALIELASVSLAGAGRLELTLRPPAHQVMQIDPTCVPPWLWMHLTTSRLRRRFELLDVTWARLFLADKLAATPEERAAVGRAADAVPADAHSLTAVDAVAVATALAPLAARIRATTVHLVGHAHLDLAWLWRWNDTVEVVQRDVETVLALMDDFPELCFTHSQAVTYEVIRQRRPDLFARLRQQIAAGRWEAATMQWVESDANLISGESAARQLLEGVNYSRQHLGRSPDVFFAPDTFGHAGNLPQLAVAAGARAYYHMRCNPGGDEQWPAYWWEGDDDSRILGLSTPTYFGEITAAGVAQSAATAIQAGHPVALQLYGICDHGGGPTRQSLETLRRLQQEPLLPGMTCSTVARYVDQLLAGEPTLPVHRGESSRTFTGCYTSRGDAKLLNRRGENLLITADTLAALAGLEHDSEVEEAWRTHLRHQFHDILAGSSISEVYDDQAADARGVEATAHRRIEQALEVLSGAAPAGTITVTNPHAWERTDAVVVPGLTPRGPVRLVGSHGHQTAGQPSGGNLCFVARVPGFSTVSYELLDGCETGALDVTTLPGGTRTRVQTPDFSVEIGMGSGAIEAWARGGSEVLPGEAALNVLQLVEEEPVVMSAWTIGRCRSEQPLLDGAETEVVEQGPVRVVLRTTRTIRSSTVTQRLAVYRDLPYVEVQLDVDWREPGSARLGIPGLKVAFATGRADSQAWYETPFAAVSRAPGAEEVPALRWAALEDARGRGVAVMNNGRHGHDATDGTLRLRLVRSPYEPDPGADIGRHHVQYAVLPLADGWRKAALPRLAAGFNAPLLARVATDAREAPAQTWALDVDADPNVLVAGLKRAPEGDAVVLRIYEAAGRAGSARLSAMPSGCAVSRATLVEDLVEEIAIGEGATAVALRPFEVMTLVVKRGAPCHGSTPAPEERLPASELS